MLFPMNISAANAASNKTRLDDCIRSAATKDGDKIRLGGGFRPAAQTKDSGKIRLGGGFRPIRQG